LRDPEDGKVHFVNLTLEDVIETIPLSDAVHAEALHRRYCDFWLVDGKLELNAARFGLPARQAPGPQTGKGARGCGQHYPGSRRHPSSVSRGPSRKHPQRTKFAREHRRLRGQFSEADSFRVRNWFIW
jgi:hypothetical protein